MVEENLKFIPGAETMDLTTTVASIEYKSYEKRRAECRPHNFTADLRKLKKEISTCNQQQICHNCVMNALESATKVRGMVFVQNLFVYMLQVKFDFRLPNFDIS